jgi:3-hydroxybutyryl-CoA dehydrogenase
MGEAMTSIQYEIRRVGKSRSFAEEHPFVDGASSEAEITVLLGSCPEGMVAGAGIGLSAYRCVAIELGTESLAFHTGGCDVPESSNVVGFSRWRLGRSAPSNLIELVTETGTKAEAASAARDLFLQAGFEVSLCADRIGRIVDRLVRPHFNLALRAVDDGLAGPDDLEECLKLGLGYRRGILAPLLASDVAMHHDVTASLFLVYGQPQYAPPRQAVVAKALAAAGKGRP